MGTMVEEHPGRRGSEPGDPEAEIHQYALNSQ